MLCGKPPRDQRTVMYRVHMKEGESSKKLKKVLQHMDSVERYEVDEEQGKVIVTGRVEAEGLMRKLRRKSGQSVELWIEDSDSTSPRRRSSWGLASSFSFSSRTTHMFDDENPNSCTIM